MGEIELLSVAKMYLSLLAWKQGFTRSSHSRSFILQSITGGKVLHIAIIIIFGLS